VEQFDAMNITGVPHVLLDPGTQRPDLAQVILRWDAVRKENVNGVLSDTEIFRPIFN
jgi:hypothetical protein